MIDDMNSDGDVIFGSERRLLSAQVNASHTKMARALSIFSNPGQTWPNGQVFYKFDNPALENTLGGIVDEAIRGWTTQAPWLRFTRRAPGAAENGVVSIRAVDCGGCNAHIGFTASEPLRMNLQQQSERCPNSGTCGAAEAAHEFGHILGTLYLPWKCHPPPNTHFTGLWHEHMRPDRDTYVQFHCEALRPDCDNMAPNTNCCNNQVWGCCGQKYNFDIVNGQDAGGKYDVESIMQYRSSAFAIPGQLTLTGNGVPSSNPSDPSRNDVLRLCKIYKTCPEYQSCANKDCPADCSDQPCPQQKCYGEAPPACCSKSPDAPEECRQRKDECRALGCDFLL